MAGRGVNSNDIGDSLGEGRSLEDPQLRWKNDKGAADPHVVDAIAAGDIPRIVQTLQDSRLLIPLAESELDASTGIKSSDMAIVCMTANDGRIGLLAFTSITSLTEWNPQARPVPITGKDAAIAALDEGASAILIDIAGANPMTITLPDLVRLTGLDQRHRVVSPLTDLCASLGVNQPVIDIPDSGPVQLAVPAIHVKDLLTALGGRSEIHAYVPEGIAVIPVI